MALLAKQAWRLIQSPDSLCARVLKAKYFPATDILDAAPMSGMSYVWRSILKVPIFEDSDDFVARHYDTKGKFSVKSAYKVHLYSSLRKERAESSSAGGEREWQQNVWRNIWQLACPPKNSHPLRINIERRGVKLVDTRCVVCKRLFENGNHLFFHCSEALLACSSAMKVGHLITQLSMEKAIPIVAFLWHWWTERNKANTGKLLSTVDDFQFSMRHYCTEWTEVFIRKKSTSERGVCAWQRPQEGFIKLNIDGSYNAATDCGGWGVLARDEVGDIMFAAAGRIASASQALQTETEALIRGILYAEQMGMEKIIVETDCQILHRALS
ncbi:hypothetical protein BRADI_3g51243v3 [Brachypodium distachyon]|uniref:RNase H type-1 domain-containing protein n=1 Tax=Brachypodium distachyon TaxID=15368 RepID=A0A2K2D4K1_BRADI|nr:hypothetical protein BRADI_3g51243v3 [Brachypodium distachyon]